MGFVSRDQTLQWSINVFPSCSCLLLPTRTRKVTPKKYKMWSQHFFFHFSTTSLLLLKVIYQFKLFCRQSRLSNIYFTFPLKSTSSILPLVLDPIRLSLVRNWWIMTRESKTVRPGKFFHNRLTSSLYCVV